MGSGENRHFFPLTSLQIGDMQSYLSQLTLFLASKSKKLLILVDNRPWLMDQDTRPTHLWQLMVTKSRLSPFANTRAKRSRRDITRRLDFASIFKFEGKETGKNVDLTDRSRSNLIKLRRLYGWYSLIDAVLHQKKTLLPVKNLKGSFLLNKELHRTLYGFIVFEVAWDHVRGINYLNELQTDTSVALEAKLMKRWEFDSIEQASNCISLWYSGTSNEGFLLREYLANASSVGDVFYDAQDDISVITPKASRERACNGSELHDDKLFYDGFSNSVFCHGGMEDNMSLSYTPPPSCGPYKRRKITKSSGMRYGVQEITEGAYTEFGNSPSPSESSSSTHGTDSDSGTLIFEATTYMDVLILFKFDDHDLPFKLKDIIMLDLRLLTLLEYGLPSWVIFLQSYPVFCQIYRPWMCPLARALYVLISIVTVLIGFYDLYKNVPLLKATASRLFGPFFDWIETWEMISRIKYLGTMLFLHNFEKAVKWFLMITRAIKSLLTVLTKPFAGPVVELVELVLPFWNMFIEVLGGMSSILWGTFGFFSSIVVSIAQILLWPFWLLFSIIWSIATLVIYPIVCILWEILIAPVHLVLAMASSTTTVILYAYYALKEFGSSISVMFHFASNPEAAIGAYEASMWRSLWNDLFSQVFRAVRSILYGFVAFFTTCNRHRLSIYNHIQEFLLRLSHGGHNARNAESLHSWQKHRTQSPLEGGESPVRCALESQEKLRRRRSRKSKDMGL